MSKSENKDKNLSLDLEIAEPVMAPTAGAVVGSLIADNTGSPLIDASRGAFKGFTNILSAQEAAKLLHGVLPQNSGISNILSGLGSLSAFTLTNKLNSNLFRLLDMEPDIKEENEKKAGQTLSPLETLLLAKKESDRKNYSEKHRLMREMLKKKPEDFLIDSEDQFVYGITHKPTNFRMHLPKNVVSDHLKKANEMRQYLPYSAAVTYGATTAGNSNRPLLDMTRGGTKGFLNMLAFRSIQDNTQNMSPATSLGLSLAGAGLSNALSGYVTDKLGLGPSPESSEEPEVSLYIKEVKSKKKKKTRKSAALSPIQRQAILTGSLILPSLLNRYLSKNVGDESAANFKKYKRTDDDEYNILSSSGSPTVYLHRYKSLPGGPFFQPSPIPYGGKDPGEIHYAHKETDKGSLAHEVGHATLDDENSLAGFNQKFLRPLFSLPSIFTIPLSLAVSQQLNKNDDPWLGAGIGAATGALFNLPTLLNEYHASNRAIKALRKAGIPEQELSSYRKNLTKAWMTYLLGSVGTPASYQLASNYLKNASLSRIGQGLRLLGNAGAKTVKTTAKAPVKLVQAPVQAGKEIVKGVRNPVEYVRSAAGRDASGPLFNASFRSKNLSVIPQKGLLGKLSPRYQITKAMNRLADQGAVGNFSSTSLRSLGNLLTSKKVVYPTVGYGAYQTSHALPAELDAGLRDLGVTDEGLLRDQYNRAYWRQFGLLWDQLAPGWAGGDKTRFGGILKDIVGRSLKNPKVQAVPEDVGLLNVKSVVPNPVSIASNSISKTVKDNLGDSLSSILYDETRKGIQDPKSFNRDVAKSQTLRDIYHLIDPRIAKDILLSKTQGAISDSQAEAGLDILKMLGGAAIRKAQNE